MNKSQHLFTIVCILALMIVLTATAIRNNTLETENYNLRQQLVDKRFELQMITETNNISTFTK